MLECASLRSFKITIHPDPTELKNIAHVDCAESALHASVPTVRFVKATSLQEAEDIAIERFGYMRMHNWGEVTEVGEPAAIDPEVSYGVADLQSLLGVARSTVYSMMQDSLRYSDIPGGRRVFGSDLIAYQRSRRR